MASNAPAFSRASWMLIHFGDGAGLCGFLADRFPFHDVVDHIALVCVLGQTVCEGCFAFVGYEQHMAELFRMQLYEEVCKFLLVGVNGGVVVMDIQTAVLSGVLCQSAADDGIGAVGTGKIVFVSITQLP